MELRDRLQPLLINHVDSCLADIPGMPKDIAGLIVEHLHLPYDVANFKNISEDDFNALPYGGAVCTPALDHKAVKTKANESKPLDEDGLSESDSSDNANTTDEDLNSDTDMQPSQQLRKRGQTYRKLVRQPKKPRIEAKTMEEPFA